MGNLELTSREQRIVVAPDATTSVEVYKRESAKVFNAGLPLTSLGPITTHLVPTGTLMMFASVTPPSGFLICDGSAVSRTTYPDLWDVCGTAFGDGDGTTTFNLPDLRGRVPMGTGQGASLTNRSLGEEVGEEEHILVTSEMPSHVHTVSDTINKSASSASNPGAKLGTTSSSPSMYAVNDGTGHTIWQRNSNSTGSGDAHNNVQPSLGINFIIKT